MESTAKNLHKLSVQLLIASDSCLSTCDLSFSFKSFLEPLDVNKFASSTVMSDNNSSHLPISSLTKTAHVEFSAKSTTSAVFVELVALA